MARSIAAILAAVGFCAAASARAETPLLELANRWPQAELSDQAGRHSYLRAAQRTFNREQPPSGAACAQSLGASRYADLHARLGEAHYNLAAYASALQSFRNAAQCRPRDIEHLTRSAESLMQLGRLAEAQETLEFAQTLATNDNDVQWLLARIAFVREDWPLAIRLSTRIAMTTRDRGSAVYWRLFQLLAQRRAGVVQPTLLRRALPEEWPAALWELATDTISEYTVVGEIEVEADEDRQREMLCEALYYRGQDLLAKGERSLAQRYFATAVNLKQLHFVEHQMAAAELTKMRTPRR
jgi:tetratricopeptide (TPR) repeat protein